MAMLHVQTHLVLTPALATLDLQEMGSLVKVKNKMVLSDCPELPKLKHFIGIQGRI